MKKIDLLPLNRPPDYSVYSVLADRINRLIHEVNELIKTEEITPEPEMTLEQKIQNELNFSPPLAKDTAYFIHQHYSGYIPKSEVLRVFDEAISMRPPESLHEYISRIRQSLEAIKGIEEPK